VTQSSQFVVADFCSLAKTFMLKRIVIPGDAFELLPYTVEVKDDDTGTDSKTIHKPLNLVVNNNDTNNNQQEDMFDRGFADVDIQSMDLSVLRTPEMDPSTGTFDFSYSFDSIHVWDSQNKQHLILPTDATDIEENFGSLPLNAISYTGQTTVWIEGISPSNSTVSLQWIPNDSEDEKYKLPCSRTRTFGGFIDVQVLGIDLDIDSDNNHGFELPENSEKEEFLENNPYANGKMVTPKLSSFYPHSRTIDPWSGRSANSCGIVGVE